jgi:hypothetical protein
MFVTIVIQHAKRMRRVILSSVSCPALSIFQHYPINGTIFGKSYWIQNGCYDFLSNFCQKYCSFSEEFSDIVINVYGSPSSRYFWQILMHIEVSRQIFEKTPVPNFIKIRPVGAEFFHAYRRTDMTKLTVAFRNSPKRGVYPRKAQNMPTFWTAYT